MTKDCPLPIDWLDFLEDRADPALAQHLEACISCRETVGRLEAVKGVRLVLRRTASVEPALGLEARDTVAPGDIWVSADSFSNDRVQYGGLDRLFLLVLRSVDRLGNTQWFDVVPVFKDIENAVPTDFCLIELETTLAVPLRIDLALQTTVSRDQLVGYLGSLTTEGEATLRQVVNGEVMIDRTGPLLEGEDDPRLTARREAAQVVRLLGSPRARLIDETEESDAPALAPRVVWLRVIASAGATGATAKLAAASQASGQVFEVAMETAEPGIEFAGELRYNPRTDAISLSLQKAIGLGDHARAVLYAVNHAARTSLPFAPEPGRDVELVNSWGVFISEVTRIELRTG